MLTSCACRVPNGLLEDKTRVSLLGLALPAFFAFDFFPPAEVSVDLTVTTMGMLNTSSAGEKTKD